MTDQIEDTTSIQEPESQGFASFITLGFWQVLDYKWSMIFAGIATLVLQFLFLSSGFSLLNSFEGNPKLLTFAIVFICSGLLFFPVVSTGLMSIINHIDKKQFLASSLLKTLFIGFKDNFYRLLAIGGLLLLAHLIFLIIIMAVLFSTQYFATNANVDLLSDQFIQYQAISVTLTSLVLYPFVIAPFIFSPLSLVLDPQTTIIQAMRNSWHCIASNYVGFALLIIFSALIFMFFLFALGMIPFLITGVISMLPWDNKFAVFQSLLMIPAIAIILGIGFCYAWLNASLYQAYKLYSQPK